MWRRVFAMNASQRRQRRRKRRGAGAALARERRACTLRTPAASDVTAHGRGKRTRTGEQTDRRWEGGKWRRCFCGWAASLSSDRSAKTVTPRGGARSTPGGARRGRAGCAARALERGVALWAGRGRNKKSKRTTHDEGGASANRGSAKPRFTPLPHDRAFDMIDAYADVHPR